MKKILFGLLLQHIIISLSFAQGSPEEINRKKDSLEAPIQDTIKAMILGEISTNYLYLNTDSCMLYGRQAVAFSRKIKFIRGEGVALWRMGAALRHLGNIPEALQNEFAALAIATKISDYKLEGGVLNSTGNIYSELGDDRNAIEYYFKAKKAYEQIQLEPSIIKVLSNIGTAYEGMGNLDSALFFLNEAYTRKMKSGNRKEVGWAEVLRLLGDVHSKLDNDSLALRYYRRGVTESFIDADSRNRATVYLSIAVLFKKLNRFDSSLKYAYSAFAIAETLSYRRAMLNASNLLAELYKTTHLADSAFKYLEISMQVRDSLFGLKKFQQLQYIILNEQQIQQKLQEEKDKLQSNYKLIASLTAVAVILLIAILLWKKNLQQRKANRQLAEQKQQIASQNNNLEKTLENLKSTQAQLIQSEKMASLGELTAGIAHEIQNPLNFVNNFSDVNTELIAEASQEIDKGNISETKTILDNIKENEEKINHHGKKADTIVKGMLQHSRSSSGIKEPTDINKLADEYLRLAYHGLRAKDKSFNVTLKTEYDESIGNINIIPQDIGRVVLNLINNAFYAVDEKKKRGSNGYEPTVSMVTKKIGDKLEVKVRDNGNGIRQKVLDKIFQPFFTTKPTGQGTGLGLSLSYDIIKAHGGEIKVDTAEGEFAEFVIQLPITL